MLLDLAGLAVPSPFEPYFFVAFFGFLAGSVFLPSSDKDPLFEDGLEDFGEVVFFLGLVGGVESKLEGSILLVLSEGRPDLEVGVRVNVVGGLSDVI